MILKKYYLFLYFILLSGPLFAQEISADSLNQKIKLHFEEYRAELYRYSGLTTYGNVPEEFSKEQIAQEILLYQQVKQSTLLNTPTNQVFALCHNLLIHSPETGKEFLALLNTPTETKEILFSLFNEFIFTGEYGEQLALKNLQTDDKNWKKTWARYLDMYATYNSSIPVIQKEIASSQQVDITVNLIGALMYIGSPSSLPFIKNIIDTTKNDAIQAEAIFVYVELSGYYGMDYLTSIKTVGEESAKEKEEGIKWLKENASQKNLYGSEVLNDQDFIDRFADIRSPAMIWLYKNGWLNDNKSKHPKAFSDKNKNTYLDLLIQSNGFGLEAGKAQLFLSIKPEDMNKLFTLRQLCYYSPNQFTKGRMKTLGIMIRHLKKQ